MSDTNKYENYNLKVIVNKRLKHSYISIDREKNILVKTPYKSQIFIDSLLEEKASWIKKKLLQIEKLKLISEEVLYTKEFLQERIDYFSTLMGLSYTKLKFRKMKSRWGSCSTKREITLNSELLKVEKKLIDYVVVHELAHIRHMNHSKAFHILVEEFLPNSEEYRRELKTIRLH